MKRRHLLAVASGSALGLISSQSLLAQTKPAPASDWKLGFKYGTAEIYPSWIVTASTRRMRSTNPNLQGDVDGVLGISMTASAAGEKFLLGCEIPDLSYSASETFQVSAPGTYSYLFPNSRFDISKLKEQKSVKHASARFSFQRAQEPVLTRDQSIVLHSIYDVPISVTPPNAEARTIPTVLAALADENFPEIERLVAEALQVGVVKGFQGYKGDEQSVINSVFSIWYSLQRRLFRLIDSTAPSAESPRVRAVRVRNFSEIFASKTASSIEIALLLAAAFRRVGYDSSILMNKTGFTVGFRVKPEAKWTPLDPTPLGMTDLSQFANSSRDNDPSRGFEGRQEVVLVAKLFGALIASQKDTKFSAANASFQAGISSAKTIVQAGGLSVAVDLPAVRKSGILGGNW